MATFTDFWYRIKGLSALWVLIVINIAVFLLLRLAGIIAMIGGWDINVVVDQLALPSSLEMLGHKPWTLLTYMFTQYGPFHILFNMLTLYWFGKMLQWRCSPSQLVWLYLYGGLAGALFYLGGAQVFPGVGGWLLGASASVIAVVIATAVMMPDFRMQFLFIGSVKLKWVAIAAVILFALGLVGDNAGGHVAHFGGITMGAIFGLLFNHGTDITRPLNKLYIKIVNFVRYPGIKFHHKAKTKFKAKKSEAADSQPSQADDRRNLDAILDKIKHSGYTALTADERRQLFDISRRVK